MLHAHLQLELHPPVQVCLKIINRKPLNPLVKHPLSSRNIYLFISHFADTPTIEMRLFIFPQISHEMLLVLQKPHHEPQLITADNHPKLVHVCLRSKILEVIDSKRFWFIQWMGHGSITKKKTHLPHAASRQDFMGRCREGALVLGGGEVVKVSSDKDCSGILHGQEVPSGNLTQLQKITIFNR